MDLPLCFSVGESMYQNMIDKTILQVRLEILKNELQELKEEENLLLKEQERIIKLKRTNRLQLQGCRAEIRSVRKELHRIKSNSL